MNERRVRLPQSLVVLPALYVVAAVLLGELMPKLDAARDVEATGAGVGTARDILARPPPG